MKVCVGGTFDILHEGHIALFERAFETGGEVVVGLSSDSLV
ncbi:MAG: phosphopantetheine adenylyltransferase, partial [Thermoplasmata archaeon]